MNSRQPSLTLKYRLIFKLGRTQTFLVKISFAWITLINYFYIASVVKPLFQSRGHVYFGSVLLQLVTIVQCRRVSLLL